MEKTEANLRAVREMCGLSQQDVADEVGVTVRSVKRWENPRQPNFVAPDDVWDYLANAYQLHREAIDTALDITKDFDKAQAVQLTIYRDQTQYDLLGRDEGLYSVANANTYSVAEALMAKGFDVAFAYPDDPDNLYHTAQ